MEKKITNLMDVSHLEDQLKNLELLFTDCNESYSENRGNFTN